MEVNLILVGLIIVVTIIISIVLTYIISKKKIYNEIIKRGTQKEFVDYKEKFEKEFYNSDEYKESQNIKYERGKEDGKNEAIIKYKESREFKSFIEHEYLKGFDDGKCDALVTYKDSLEFDAILKNEFRRGKELGQKEELSKLKIVYDTWNDYNDGFFKQHYIDGYNMQLYYNNMPIGYPSRRVLTRKKKFKEENLFYLVDQLKYAIEKYIDISTGLGISTILTTKEPKKIDSDIKVD